MDILSILLSKPNNTHYIIRYYRFILSCQEYNAVNTASYTEMHHICPKSKDMFPEYKSLKQYPWNGVRLTHRQHVIAHIMLWKAYNNISQSLSILRTSGQKHIKDLSVAKVNSRFIEKAKINLSNARKGKFPGGYLPDGSANVSKQTREKLSNHKKQFYSDPKNREKQSIACKGTTGRVSEKYSIAAKNRSEETLMKMKTSKAETWSKKRLNGTSKRIKEGVYVTPIGNFSSIPEYSSYCRNPDKQFNIHHIKKNPKLNQSVVGMTPRELGFFFVVKEDPEFERYCVDLNQAHPPAPNHPLLLELSGYLSREMSLQIP